MKYKDSVIKTCSAGASTASKKKRGEILFDLDFVNTMEEELKEMNKRRMKSNEKLTLIGDAAYDARENFNMLAESGHRPLFKVRINSSSLSRASPARRRREKRTGARELDIIKYGGWNIHYLI